MGDDEHDDGVDVKKPEPTPPPERVCPNCDGPLHGRKCKTRCKRCGYFDDCSIGPA